MVEFGKIEGEFAAEVLGFFEVFSEGEEVGHFLFFELRGKGAINLDAFFDGLSGGLGEDEFDKGVRQHRISKVGCSEW